jgi:hypothetical protein
MPIKIAQTKENQALKAYKRDNHPRAGSDTIEVIENLYHIKPDKPKSQEYEHNIMEVAHPEKEIIAPAYDPLNGLVENNIERQNILLNILRKPANGQSTQHRYASELAKSIAKVATDLENKHQTELSKWADTCLSQLSKQALDFSDFFEGKGSDIVDVGEGAGVGAIIGGALGGLIGVFGGPIGIAAGAAGGAALGGMASALFKTGPQAKNISINAQEAQLALQKLMAKVPSNPFLEKLSNALQGIQSSADAYSRVVSELDTEGAGHAEEAEQIGKTYQDRIVQLDRMIDIFLAHAKSGEYAEQNASWLDKLEAPWKAIVGDYVSDAVRAMETLEVVTHDALKGIMAVRSRAQALHSAPVASPAPAMTPAAPVATNQGDFSQYLAQMEEMLKGQK